MRDPLAAALTRAIGVHVIEGSAEPVAGGSIHRALRYRTKQGSVFVKTGPASTAAMFAAEADGLNALANAAAIRVPAVLGTDTDQERAFICLEWLEFDSGRSADARLGTQLAHLHRSQASTYGAPKPNFIGRTQQDNRQSDEWVMFFRERRLIAQLDLAHDNRADKTTLDRGYRLAESLDAFFVTYRPVASLLHGDLWGGNWGTLRQGEPAVFDPAAYYGDRETDIAMTRLFGGFSAEFYAAYEQAWPRDDGAADREPLYNLYHVLNHFNLFGGAYLSQARSLIDRLLAALGC